MTHGREKRNRTAICSVLCLAALLQILIMHSANAQESQRVSPDARALGMGKAYTAIAEGASASWWNPGALGLLDRISLTFFSQMDFGPGSDGGKIIHRSFGIGGRQGALGYGVHLNHIQWGEVDLYGENFERIGAFKPFDYTLLMGAGTDLLPALRIRNENIRFGVGSNLRFVHYNAPPAKFTHDGRDHSGTGWDFDLGTLATARLPFHLKPTGHSPGASYVALRFGAVQTAVLKRQIGSDTGARGGLERLKRVAGAVELGIADVRPIGHLVRAVYAVESHKEQFWSADYGVWGLEVTLFNFLSIRTGRINDPDHSYVVDTHGFGAGFHVKKAFGARIDYAKHRRGMFKDDLDMYTLSVSLDPDLLTPGGR